MTDIRVPVLVVGAGPVGISTALFLARHGVGPLLVEQRDGTSTRRGRPGCRPGPWSCSAPPG